MQHLVGEKGFLVGNERGVFMSRLHCKKISKNNDRIYFATGVETSGLTAWYYIKVDTLKESIFKYKCSANSSFNLNDFGEIVASGWGDTPPEEIKNKIEGEI